MTTTDRARVITYVAVSPRDAFEVFTEEIDTWWRREPRFRAGVAASQLRFERDGNARRLVERSSDGVFEIGRVRAWEPGARLVFEWRTRDFAAGEVTEVEVLFTPLGEGTRVTLEHRGWDTLRADHPSRRGLDDEAFTSMLGLHWGDLVTAYRAAALAKRSG